MSDPDKPEPEPAPERAPEETSPPPPEPVVTVRMQRERILRALADDIEANVAELVQPRATTSPGRESARLITHPGAPVTPATPAAAVDDEPAEDDLDPIELATAALGRLRERARTDLAELRVQYQRHDIFVVVLALVIIFVAGRLHSRMLTPPNKQFAEHGLTFDYPSVWLAREAAPLPAPRLAHDPNGSPIGKDPDLYHVELTSHDATAKLEVLIDKKPAWSNIVTGLDLDRRTRWGELYALDDSSVRVIDGHGWLRTSYHYAHVADKRDEPRVDRAVEYATVDREQIYVVTMFAEPGVLSTIEDVIAPSLEVASQTGLPLVPQTGRLSQRTYPNGVARAFDSTVMVVVADLVDGRLKPRGGGSGVIVGADGSILTSYHVMHDKDGRLHDVFVIGRFAPRDEAPQLFCAGRPSRSKLQKDVDLALLKCDTDLDGRSWSPSVSGGIWPTLPTLSEKDIKIGQRLWVLGYPDNGGGGLTLSEGEVTGWTGVDGAEGRDYLKTDASITNGNSGGPVVDDAGRLVGIASGVRLKVGANGAITETSGEGLVRPLGTASDLLAIATAGWTPREGHTSVELEPTAVEAPAEGVRISTKVLDAANEEPVRDALVMVLRPGVSTTAVDMNRLDDQVLSWGRSNTLGEVILKQPVPVPGNYSVMVVARGYEPLIGESELHLDAKTPPNFDPWGKIWLRTR